MGSRRKRWPYLVEAVVGYVLQDDGLHGEHVGKLHLWDVQRADDVCPAWGRGRDRVEIHMGKATRVSNPDRAAGSTGVQGATQLRSDVRLEILLVAARLANKSFVGDRQTGASSRLNKKAEIFCGKRNVQRSLSSKAPSQDLRPRVEDLTKPRKSIQAVNDAEGTGLTGSPMALETKLPLLPVLNT